MKPCREIGQSFEESLREGKLVYNKLEIFLMTNKTIIEFGFRKMKRIMQIVEDDVIHLGPSALFFTPYSASLYSTIAK